MKSVDGETDDTGEFEFWNLRPGTYFLAVKANPWFALHPPQKQLDQAGSQEEREAMAALDVAYPMEYFDGGSDESAATPIEIKSGDRVQADVSLHAVPALRVTIHMPAAGTATSRYFGPGTLKSVAFGMQDWPGVIRGSFVGDAESGVGEVDGVAPGHYTVLGAGRSTDIDASGDQDVNMSTAMASMPVELKVRMSDATPPPGKLKLTLVSDGAGQEHYPGDVDSKGVARFGLVPPGRWNVMAESGTLALAVISTQTGTAQVADSRIVVRDKKVSGTVVLALGKTNIEGFAQKSGKGEAGVMVVLVPRNPDASLAEFRRDQSDSDGSFLLRDVAPGEYTVVAIEDGWEMNWARGEVIGKYVAKGIPVRVTAGAPKMELNRAVEVQPR